MVRPLTIFGLFGYAALGFSQNQTTVWPSLASYNEKGNYFTKAADNYLKILEGGETFSRTSIFQFWVIT